jgi:hypothetical protein
MTDELLTPREDGIVMLVLSRPDKRDAMTKPLWQRHGDCCIC